MKFPRLLSVPVLLMAAALTLTACGGGSGSGDVVRIDTTESGPAPPRDSTVGESA